MVGGRDYDKSQFNRAVDAKRQPGSAFKPFVYLSALELGLTPNSVTIDAPIQIGNWKPQNYGKTYRGEVTLQTALALSINTVAARLGELVGPETVVTTAHRLGIMSDLKAMPSIALGTSEVTPLELTAAYVPFANGGYGIVPHVVKRITAAADGKLLYERSGDGPGIVIGSRELGMMNAMLRQTLQRGTGTKADIPGWDAAGKTGTSQDYRDAWFVGYTANLTTGVWFGNDDNTPTKRTTGGSLPAQVWSRFMTAAHEGVPVAALPGNYGRQEPEYVARSEPFYDSAGRYIGDQFGGNGTNYGGTPSGAQQPPGVRRHTNNPAYETYERGPAGPDDQYYADDPQYDPRYADDQQYDPRYADEPQYDPRYPDEPNYDPRYAEDPGAPGPDYFANGPMVPPADVQGQAEDYPYRPRRRGNFLERLFGG
jgi:penicillin-binding protein 1A